MALNDLRELYIHELRDLYSAEKQITKALPKMIKAATHDELRSAFEEHLEVTREQMSRLEQIFERYVRGDGAERAALEGQGLGLHIVRSLVELHGGAVGVESVPGSGATFWFSLPVPRPLGAARSAGDGVHKGGGR